MPDGRSAVPFFVVFRGRAMCLRRKLVLLGGSPVCLVHGVSSCGSDGNSPLMCTRRSNLCGIGNASLEMALRELFDAGLTTGLPVRTLHLQW
jgi:hypothetical protein